MPSTTGEQVNIKNIFRRSQSSVYNKQLCFFCDEGPCWNNQLHKVATTSAGESLKKAVELSGNDNWRVKLSTAIDPKDAHAIDIQYHLKCWGKNVSHILRKPEIPKNDSNDNANEIAAEIEFISLLRCSLKQGSTQQTFFLVLRPIDVP